MYGDESVSPHNRALRAGCVAATPPAHARVWTHLGRTPATAEQRVAILRPPTNLLSCSVLVRLSCVFSFSQVEASLEDDTRSRRRAHPRRADVAVVGRDDLLGHGDDGGAARDAAELAEDDEDEALGGGALERDAYDDTESYAHLLRELVDVGPGSSGGGVAGAAAGGAAGGGVAGALAGAGAAGAQAAAAAAAAAARARKKRARKEVDTRASKGRKIKYVVHAKLAEFCFPSEVRSRGRVSRGGGLGLIREPPRRVTVVPAQRVGASHRSSGPPSAAAARARRRRVRSSRPSSAGAMPARGERHATTHPPPAALQPALPLLHSRLAVSWRRAHVGRRHRTIRMTTAGASTHFAPPV